MASFNPAATAPAISLPPPKLDREGLELFFRITPFASAKRILEIGAGSGRLVEIILSSKATSSASYDALIFRAEPADSLRSQILRFAGQAKVAAASAEDPFPFADHSHNLAFCCYILERLRKDQLYMVLAEARRVLPAGSYFSVLYRSPEKTFLRRVLAALTPGREPEIELNHFISPEDWEIHGEEEIRSHGAISKVMLLKRKNG